MLDVLLGVRVCVCICVCVLCVICVPLQFSGSTWEVILPFRRHLAMSGGHFGGHCWEKGSGYSVRVRMLLNISRHRTVPISPTKSIW